MRVCPSTRSVTRCRTPALIWRRTGSSERSGTSSATWIDPIAIAATTNEAASMRATDHPPSHAKSAAPSNGPKSR